LTFDTQMKGEILITGPNIKFDKIIVFEKIFPSQFTLLGVFSCLSKKAEGNLIPRSTLRLRDFYISKGKMDKILLQF